MQAGQIMGKKNAINGPDLDPNSVGYMIRRIHTQLEKNANNSLRADSITLPQSEALRVLCEQPDGSMNLKNLEQQIQLAQSTTVGIAARLCAKHYAELRSDPRDRRVKIITVTEAGREVSAKAQESLAAIAGQLLGDFTDEERAEFVRLLAKVCSHLQG
jgi:DNA-binding MarR family transcriptional regulator